MKRKRNGDLFAKDNPEKVKTYRLTAKAKRYGLEPEQWLQKLLSQDNKCAICEQVFEAPNDIHTDHNHRTGNVRGFLCKTCNLGLGYFGDSMELLHQAITYLRCS